MTRITRWTTTLTLAAALVLALVALTARGAATPAAAEPAGACPVLNQPSAAGFALAPAGVGNPEDRLADRNGDGLVCRAQVRPATGAAWTVLTDNLPGSGGAGITQFAFCPSPFATVTLGSDDGRGDPYMQDFVLVPRLAPTLRAIDANGDGRLCAFTNLTTRTHVIVDNSGSGDPYITSFVHCSSPCR